ncbi:unnamed protein product [Rhizoctonia solani]|uniref:Uncharacterized protein n=1 Tax=Rhizoctonia solani TaxID=456999 RepID=A0A8H3DVP4_9AGAM|nr:unnamed protein product [Rhizoctonia solani]
MAHIKNTAHHVTNLWSLLSTSPNMARGEPPQPVVLTVPRHGSAATSGDLLTEIKQLAESEGKQFANDHGGSGQSARSKAAAQASEWNSLLISARAGRGPQWDVGLQQYLVDKDSNLYFDPTPLTAESVSPNAEGQDGMDLASGQHPGNSGTGTPITPKTGEDGSAPPFERRRTRAGGGGY